VREVPRDGDDFGSGSWCEGGGLGRRSRRGGGVRAAVPAGRGRDDERYGQEEAEEGGGELVGCFVWGRGGAERERGREKRREGGLRRGKEKEEDEVEGS